MTNDERNEDWIKTLRWDIRGDDGQLVATLDELREATGASDDHLRSLPMIDAAPAAIRTALGLPVT